MNSFKYFLIFILPLAFLSIVGKIFTSLPETKKLTKKLNTKIDENINLVKSTDAENKIYLYTIIIDTNNTNQGLEFTYLISKKFRDKGINVYLTRNLDYEIQQEEKFEILYKIKADLYLHLNPVHNLSSLYFLSTLNSKVDIIETINFIPNAIEKSTKSLKIEKNLLDSFSFYFSLKDSSITSKYSKVIDVPIDIPSILFSLRYERARLNSIADLIVKAVIMGLSSKI